MDGNGSLVAVPDGLAWELKKGFRKHSGLVAWDRITKWEAGLQGRAWVAFVSFVTHGPEQGFLGLHTHTAAPIKELTDFAAQHLGDGIVQAAFP
jgi:hypothetical protein